MIERMGPGVDDVSARNDAVKTVLATGRPVTYRAGRVETVMTPSVAKSMAKRIKTSKKRNL